MRQLIFEDNASTRIFRKGMINIDDGKTKTHNVLKLKG